MLYLYAYDLLGAKPEDLGSKHQQSPASFSDILQKYRHSAITDLIVGV
jgi:hypothetical protein